MKKIIILSFLLLVSKIAIGQTTTPFDNLNANYGVNKSILWYSSNYGSGFGHRIINSDPGGKTLLNFQGRHNSSGWSDILTLTSNGRVGIGSNDPKEKLNVVGKAQFYDPASTSKFLHLDYATNQNKIRSYGGNLLLETRNATNGIEFRTNNSASTLMSIKGNGDVSVGNIQPISKFHVATNENTISWPIIANNVLNQEIVSEYGIGIKLKHSGNNELNKWGGIASVQESSWANYSGLALFANETEYMRIRNNGDVGIGTSQPTEKLDVVGTIKSNKLLVNDPNDTNDWNTLWQSGFYQSYNATNAPEPNQWFWGLNMNHGSNNANYKYNGQIAIRNSATSPRMYFRSTNKDGVGNWSRIVHSEGNQYIEGALGIGTTTPDAKLAVNGNIHTREVKVDLQGWPDYVFEDTYNLPTLDKVEQHIQQKGHLINIPSAAEVAENGIYLGEMNAKLLEKIEELTLYTIQQEKRIQELELTNHSVRSSDTSYQTSKTIEELTLYTIAQEKRIQELEDIDNLRDAKIKALENKMEQILNQIK